MWIPVSVQNLVERIRRFTNFRGVYNKDPTAMPVLVVNDNLQGIVMTKSASATSSTDTTLFTTPPLSNGRTFITAFTISAGMNG